MYIITHMKDAICCFYSLYCVNLLNQKTEGNDREACSALWIYATDPQQPLLSPAPRGSTLCTTITTLLSELGCSDTYRVALFYLGLVRDSQLLHKHEHLHGVSEMCRAGSSKFAPNHQQTLFITACLWHIVNFPLSTIRWSSLYYTHMMHVMWLYS